MSESVDGRTHGRTPARLLSYKLKIDGVDYFDSVRSFLIIHVIKRTANKIQFERKLNR